MNRSISRFLDDLDRRDEERRTIKTLKHPLEAMSTKEEFMKEIRLNNLTLRDFQGGSLALDVSGSDAYIYGQNTSGKTRLVSAFTWLLFNKDALGRADFQIKNLDATGEAAHNLEHTVEAELSVNGQPCVLRKVFSEKWTKKRGSANREFSGHTTQYFVQGVPVQEKDYLSRIADIAGDESRFRLLTSPTTFPQLHWQKQRQLLLDICGDISDEDIISSNEKLSPLLKILGKRTLDDHRKIVTARRSEINKEMERLPIRIDEVRRGLPDITGIDRQASEKEAQALETALNDAKLRLQGVNTGGNVGALTTKLSGLNADLRKMEDAHRSGSLFTLNHLNQKMSELTERVNSSRRRITGIDEDLKRKNVQIQTMDTDLGRLRDRWAVIDAEKFKDTTVDICPACDRPLPPERVQEARDKTLAAFNQSKADRLGDIDRKGHALKDQKNQLEQQVNDLTEEAMALEEVLSCAESDLKKIEQQRDELKDHSEDFSGIQNRADLLDEIEDMESQILGEREGKTQDIEKIKVEIANLQSDLHSAKTKADLFRAREQGEKRIEELKQIEKVLSAEYEKLEGELYLSDLFIKMKVELLTDKINSKFETVRFKLFTELINGGIEPTCEILVNGVGYNSGLNNAARIQAGLEIVRVLQTHYELICPTWLDNRESFTEIPKMPGQVISLYVSPKDTTLRVELSEKAK